MNALLSKWPMILTNLIRAGGPMPRRATRPGTIRGEHPGDPPIVWRLDAPEADPTLPLVVGLHGQGMDEDFFARVLRGLLDQPVRVLLPRAPFPIEGRSAGRNGASWYDYDGDQERFRTELQRTEALVLDLISAVEREQGLTPRRRWLMGFSQGGYCGSWIAVRNTGLFHGMAIVSARVKTEFLADEMRRAAASRFEVLLCHGRQDVSVHPDAAERSRAGLAEAGVPVELRWFDSGHSLGKRQVEAIAEWLKTKSL